MKMWSAGSPIQAPLDGLEAIRSKRPFEATQVERILVRLAPSAAAVVDNRGIHDICLEDMIEVILIERRFRSVLPTTSRACRIPPCYTVKERDDFPVREWDRIRGLRRLLRVQRD